MSNGKEEKKSGHQFTYVAAICSMLYSYLSSLLWQQCWLFTKNKIKSLDFKHLNISLFFKSAFVVNISIHETTEQDSLMNTLHYTYTNLPWSSNLH